MNTKHETLDIEGAAAYLHMSTSALRSKIKSGEIKAVKPAKKWVFFLHDLVVYLRSKYTEKVEISSSGSIHQEVKLCHYSDATKRGGLTLQHQTDNEYDVLLGRKKEI